MFGLIKKYWIINIQNVYCYVVKNLRLNLLLLIHMLINTPKDYITIHLQLIWIDILEVLILLMTYQ